MSEAPSSRVLRITSGCATRASFVSYFRSFCEDESIFIATPTPKPSGDRVRVSIGLSTGEALIVGSGVIGESYRGPDSSFGRPGMRIHFDELSPESRALFTEMGAGRDENATVKAPALPAMMAMAAAKHPPMVPAPPAEAPEEPEAEPEAEAEGVAEPAAVPAPGPAAVPAAEEQRAPGSSFILPANPLSEMDPEQLFAFVECTMVEEELETGAPMADEPPARQVRDTEPAALPQEAEGTTTERGFAPAAELPTMQVPAMPRVMPGAATEIPSRPPRSGRAFLIGAVVGALPALAIGVLIGRATRADEDWPAAAGAPTPTPNPTPTPTMTPDAAPAAPPVAGAEPDCELHVTSVPDGATVRTGQLRLGQTPLDIPLPCGRHELSIRRPRYADVDRTITLTRGTPGTALVHLERPDYTLRVDATPRAMVTIDGKSAGLSPVTATVHGHTPVDVSVSLAGYAPWSKQVKLSKNMRLDARLELLKPGGKPKKP